ncbi:LiaF transmembrane domain-containing protein [Salinibaculum salinum]|uniref:LiaF transmembrane domain-containing protein n=1 Tax=Salinibaculum salinum TaxID=3131996 RepID=UPI0030ECF484
MSQRQRTLSSQLLLGALIVLVGIVLLADTTGLFDTAFLFDYIPSLFVLLGVYALVRSGFRNIFGPFVIITLAAVWQLTTLDIIEGADLIDFWPVFIILFGLSLVLSQFRSPPAKTGSSHVTGFGIFGGSEKRVTTSKFTGANLTAIFGGAEIDLREAGIAQPPAHVSAIALFGGVEVTVPEEWNVDIDVLPIFGGASDERRRTERTHEEVDLVVTGFAAFGGVEVND